MPPVTQLTADTQCKQEGCTLTVCAKSNSDKFRSYCTGHYNLLQKLNKKACSDINCPFGNHKEGKKRGKCLDCQRQAAAALPAAAAAAAAPECTLCDQPCYRDSLGAYLSFCSQHLFERKISARNSCSIPNCPQFSAGRTAGLLCKQCKAEVLWDLLEEVTDQCPRSKYGLPCGKPRLTSRDGSYQWPKCPTCSEQASFESHVARSKKNGVPALSRAQFDVIVASPVSGPFFKR